MDFLELMENRYSVRSYKDRPVEQEKIAAILRAGQVAPTAHNNQPQKILVIESAEALEKLRRCTTSHFNAPLVILTCYDKNLCWQREYDRKLSGDIDAAIVTTHMMLEATELGLGSTWVMHFIPKAVRVEFELPENYVPVSILTVGYAADNAKPAPAHKIIKELSETTSYDRFTE